ncbi:MULTISPECIES: uracil-DNA glycosylase [unclassified Pseudarthrobacter]|uniref:uracil-DNA glycosylase n=1 Tax=unclassified Pseudarthrobacter TaxID=2647000 RepID=UPI003CC68980
MFDPEPLFDLPPTRRSEDDAAELRDMATRPLADLMAPDWATALVSVEPDLRKVLSFVADEAAAGHLVLPAPSNILRAFRQPLADVRVLVVGQDPYPTPGHAVGLSFAVERTTRPIPRSLANIYRELEADLGLPPRVHGDLSAWTDQGVLLLNTVLTVREGAAASHRGKGWEPVTAAAIRAVAGRRRTDGTRQPLVAILWGRDAQNLGPLLDGAPAVASAHPSPLSASRGFFGSRPFSTVNTLLEEQGAAPVSWELPS